jgi:hypothetical protein
LTLDLPLVLTEEKVFLIVPTGLVADEPVFTPSISPFQGEINFVFAVISKIVGPKAWV